MIGLVQAAYTAVDVLVTLLVFFGWIAFIVLAIWLLVGAIRDPDLQWWIKVLLVLFIIVFPPVALIGGFAFWLDRRSRSSGYRSVWENPTTPVGVSSARPMCTGWTGVSSESKQDSGTISDLQLNRARDRGSSRLTHVRSGTLSMA